MIVHETQARSRDAVTPVLTGRSVWGPVLPQLLSPPEPAAAHLSLQVTCNFKTLRHLGVALWQLLMCGTFQPHSPVAQVPAAWARALAPPRLAARCCHPPSPSQVLTAPSDSITRIISISRPCR